jgi:hypothetical protein
MATGQPEKGYSMSRDDFWGKKDLTSMARSMRLAVIQNLYDADRLTEDEARGLLNGCLEPGNELTRYDDSDCLIWKAVSEDD